MPRKKNEWGLLPRQELFCREYVVDVNAKEAYLRAGYTSKWPEVDAHALLQNPNVKRRVNFLKIQRNKRMEINADAVLKELARVAFGDIRALFDDEGALKRPHEWSDDVAAAISSAEMTTVRKGEGEVEHVARVRSYDKLKALELLGKHLRLFVDRKELSGPDGGPMEIQSGRDKLASALGVDEEGEG